MNNDDLTALREDLIGLGLTPYCAERVVAIAPNLPPRFTRVRLLGIGLDRLWAIAPILSEKNALDLLQLAEQHPADELIEIIEGREPKGKRKSLRVTTLGLDRIERAFEAAGVPKVPGRSEYDELGLLSRIDKLAQRAAIARTFSVDPSKPTNSARLVLRVEGARPWTLDNKRQLAEAIEELLRKNIGTLTTQIAIFPEMKGARITRIEAYKRGPDLPANGQRAAQMGFGKADNPHKPGSRLHRLWDESFERVDWSFKSLGD